MIEISKIAQSKGVSVDEYPFEHIRGCVCCKDGKFYIGISKHLDPIKKRMVIAHELAHIEDDTVDSVYVFTAETRAKQKAREMLIPCEAFSEAIIEGLTDYATLASIFGVSEKMIKLRCKDLGYDTI